MKEIDVERVVDDCTAQLYHDAIYATESAMRAFHAKVNADPNAVVGAWSDGARTIKFVMPMNVPAMLKKTIGMDAVPVVETQKIEWEAVGSCFKVVSEPQLNFPGANKFTTSGSLEVKSLPGRRCKVKALVRCSAAMPWPVQATVEGLMATEASTSIGVFLDFCVDFYKSWRAEQQLQPERPAAAAAAAAAGGPAAVVDAEAAAAGDQFFDAVEDESELRSAAAAGAEAGGEASVVPYTPQRLEDVIVDCLRKIQSSSTETAQTLRTLEELLRNMDDNIQDLREKLVGRRPPPRPAASGAGSRPGAAAGAPGSAVPRTGSSGSVLGFLAAASLVCGVGAFVYVRYRVGAGGGGGGGGSS